MERSTKKWHQHSHTFLLVDTRGMARTGRGTAKAGNPTGEGTLLLTVRCSVSAPERNRFENRSISVRRRLSMSSCSEGRGASPSRCPPQQQNEKWNSTEWWYPLTKIIGLQFPPHHTQRRLLQRNFKRKRNQLYALGPHVHTHTHRRWQDVCMYLKQQPSSEGCSYKFTGPDDGSTKEEIVYWSRRKLKFYRLVRVVVREHKAESNELYQPQSTWHGFPLQSLPFLA